MRRSFVSRSPVTGRDCMGSRVDRSCMNWSNVGRSTVNLGNVRDTRVAGVQFLIFDIFIVIAVLFIIVVITQSAMLSMPKQKIRVSIKSSVRAHAFKQELRIHPIPCAQSGRNLLMYRTMQSLQRNGQPIKLELKVLLRCLLS